VSEICGACGEKFEVKVVHHHEDDGSSYCCGECGVILCSKCLKNHSYDDCVQQFIDEQMDD